MATPSLSRLALPALKVHKEYLAQWALLALRVPRGFLAQLVLLARKALPDRTVLVYKL